MRNFILSILAAVVSAYAIGDVTIPNTFSDSALIIASEFNENFDTLALHHNRLIDTLQDKYIAYYDLQSGDSTLSRLQADTIRGNPDIDSARIRVITGADIIRGNPDVDSISGSPKINAVTVIGTASVDSLFSTKGVKATTGTFSGTMSADSIYSTTYGFGSGISTTTGTFSGTVSADSVYGVKGLTAGGEINTNSFKTGTVTLADDDSATINAILGITIGTLNAFVFISPTDFAGAVNCGGAIIGNDGIVQIVAGSSFDIADTDLKTCFYYGGTAGVYILKNRLGFTKTFRVWALIGQ